MHTEMTKVEIHNQDCMIAMASMKDKEYDLAIVDPPYAVGANDGTFGRRSGEGYSKDRKYAPTPIMRGAAR